ncbi:hypothetical protein L484_000537 [Morus notabilis]|uniref:F-box protein At3g26010-like beta-propeller domain-containing protein n=2 Tax=Morus notabilis TaxID=981085 RepID=W9T1Z4_9ROSA|nr:hypothetical protein L484_000537 [Morus notabilis]
MKLTRDSIMLFASTSRLIKMGEKNSGGGFAFCQNHKTSQVNGDDNGQNQNFSLVPCRRKRKSTQIEKPSTTLSNLGRDLLLHIFLLLPDCQSAIKCLAVSKLWNFLISDSCFISSFVQRQHSLNSAASMPYTLLIKFFIYQKFPVFSEKSEILHQRRLPSLSSSNYLSFLPSTPFGVRACYNDLLLVSMRARSHYCICNPLTRKFVALPNPPEPSDALPRNAPRCPQYRRFGLAWQSTTNEQCYNYRVVLIAILSSSNRFIITVFSSESGKWNMYVVSSPRPLLSNLGSWNMKHVVFANGKLHWIEGVKLIKGIIAFDPFDHTTGSKSCFYIDLPAELPRICFLQKEICFGACQGRLLISYSGPRMAKCSFTLLVWELRNYDNNADTWYLKHYIRNRSYDMIGIHESDDEQFRVVGFHPSDGDVVFLCCKNHVYELNLITSRSRKIGDFPVEAKKFYVVFPLVHPFWPTPVPKFPSVLSILS